MTGDSFNYNIATKVTENHANFFLMIIFSLLSTLLIDSICILQNNKSSEYI